MTLRIYKRLIIAGIFFCSLPAVVFALSEWLASRRRTGGLSPYGAPVDALAVTNTAAAVLSPMGLLGSIILGVIILVSQRFGPGSKLTALAVISFVVMATVYAMSTFGRMGR